MYDGNPEEIDFGSSSRETRVSEGSSYRESTALSQEGTTQGDPLAMPWYSVNTSIMIQGQAHQALNKYG